MREIEFRAWTNGGESNNFDHVMTYDLAFAEFAPINELLNGVNKCGALMQYTGLKDRNGVKIFEGDIVSVRYCDDDDVSIGKVAWMDCYYPAFDIYVPSDRAASGFEPYHDEFNSFSCPDFIIQVIGNIYQDSHLLKNPELLEA